MQEYKANLQLLKTKKFPIDVSATMIDKELRSSFSAQDWLVIDQATLLKKAANVYAGASSKRAELVHEAQVHIDNYDFDQALETLVKIPVSNITSKCLAWKRELARSVKVKKLIKKAIIRLLSDDESTAEH